MPSRLVPVRAWASRPPTVMGSPVTYRMQFSHIASDTSHGAGAASAGADAPWLVVRCARRCSASLSNSIVNATSAWDSRADRGRAPFSSWDGWDGSGAGGRRGVWRTAGRGCGDWGCGDWGWRDWGRRDWG